MEYIHDAEDVIQQRISPLRLVGEKALWLWLEAMKLVSWWILRLAMVKEPVRY